MTGWIVVLAVIAFLLLLLLCPLCLSVSYEGEWKVKVRYLFVRYPLYPRKPSKKKEKKRQNTKRFFRKTKTERKIFPVEGYTKRKRCERTALFAKTVGKRRIRRGQKAVPPSGNSGVFSSRKRWR